MAVFSDAFLVLGAFFGIASVYVAPTQRSSESVRHKMKSNENNRKNRSTVIVPDSNNTFKTDESRSKLYGDTTMNDVLSMIKTEISNLLSAEKWTIIFPKEKSFDLSPDFYDAKSQFVTPNTDNPFDSGRMNDIIDDCTEYKDFPEILFSGSNLIKKKKKNNLHKYYRGITRSDISEDNKYRIYLPRQSTLINSKSRKYPKFVILGENSAEELESFAADSGFSVITVENNNIEFSFKKSRSPINRLFQGVKSFLGVKRNSYRENDNRRDNFSIITDNKFRHNNTT